MNNKINYSVINDGDLESGIKDDFQTLIIPAAKYLSDKEINSVKEFVKKGGSVLLTWQSGVNNELGIYRGWQDWKGLYSINGISEIDTNQIINTCLIKSSNQISAGIPAGSKISFQIKNNPVQFTFGKNIFSPILDHSKNSTGETSSIVYGNAGGGKFIWFGFDILSAAGNKDQIQNFNRMIINSLNWLNNEPVLWLNTWPQNKSNAVVIGYDVDFTGTSLQNFINVLNNENVKAQFFIPLNIKNIDTLTYLKNYGDITFFEDNYYEWRNISPKVDDLKYLESGIEEITGNKINSFRIPAPSFNAENLKALANSGFTTVNSTINHSYYLPWFDRKNDSMLIIPNTGLDDYDFKSETKNLTSDELAEKYYQNYTLIAGTGGFYILNYHNVYRCSPGEINAVGTFINKLKNDAWVTTFDGLYNWWEVKTNLTAGIKANEKEKNVYDVTLKNNSTLNGKDIELTFALGTLNKNSKIKITEGAKEINFSFNPQRKEVSIYINSLPANETKHIKIEIGNFS